MKAERQSPAGDIRIGISGWRYPPWRGVFYPPDLPQRRELEFASRQFNTIEINGSFYSLQRPGSYMRWYESTPEDFIFSVKGGRYITHILRLKEAGLALANFFASGVFNLRGKLGPFLWQFPPSLRYQEELFETFFELLPSDTEAALSLARRRERRMTGRTCLAIDRHRPLRHAVEIRHASFVNDRFIQQLRHYGIALVVADTAGKWPLLEDLTADFSYVRLHGDEELYVSGYTEPALDRWAGHIRRWAAGRQAADPALASPAPLVRAASPRDVYCYFDNDVKVRAPVDARRLLAKLSMGGDGPNSYPAALFGAPLPGLAAFTSAELAARWKFKKGKRKPGVRAKKK